jgi:hypothetical protein
VYFFNGILDRTHSIFSHSRFLFCTASIRFCDQEMHFVRVIAISRPASPPTERLARRPHLRSKVACELLLSSLADRQCPVDRPCRFIFAFRRARMCNCRCHCGCSSLFLTQLRECRAYPSERSCGAIYFISKCSHRRLSLALRKVTRFIYLFIITFIVR